MTNSSHRSLLGVVLCLMPIAIGIIGVVLFVSSTVESGGETLDRVLMANFGQAEAGAEIQHSFDLVNPNPFAVRVVNVSSSCGCTVSSDPGEIAAFSKFTIPVSIALPERPGEFHSKVQLTFSSGETVELQLRGNVTRDVQQSIDFGRVLENTETVRYLDIRPHGSSPRLLKVDYDPELLSIDYIPGPIGDELTIPVTFLPQSERGRTVETSLRVRLGTGERGEREWVVRVRGHVMKGIECVPEKLLFGLVEDEVKVLNAVIESPYDETLEVIELTSSHPEALVPLVESLRISGTSLVIPIELRPHGVSRGFAGEVQVRLRLDERRTETVTIPAYALRKEYAGAGSGSR